MDQPWLTEPLYETWIHSSGLVCEIARVSNLGVWCGYVQVPEDHPIRVFNLDPCEWDSDKPTYVDLKVHGGVTWNSADNLTTCPEKDTYRIGFDCGHAWDLNPKSQRILSRDRWRDIEYARAETNSLADQISKIRIVPEGFAL